MIINSKKNPKGIEVGTFVGYSALCFAEGLPEDGKLITYDISEEYVNIGKPFWKEAGVEGKIESRIKPAAEELTAMAADESQKGTYDFGYVDADKVNYHLYVKALIELIKPKGFIIIDNTLWSGSMANPDARENDCSCKAIYNSWKMAIDDPRLDVTTVAIADGVTLIVKK